jgi:ABC-type dipeptide/oligopeptide/nickel transport system permease component
VSQLAGRSARATTLGLGLAVDVVAPLAFTVALVAIITDPARIDVSELRANSLLMSARPLFRDVAPSAELRVALSDSAILLLTALVGAVAVGLPTGVAYGWWSRGGPLKAVVWSAAALAASLPAFFWAVVLEIAVVLLYFRLGFRLLPNAGFGVDEHLVLPALALGLRPAAYIFRLTAVTVEENRHADYVRTGIAKGLSGRQLLVRHVLPNTTPGIVAAVVLGARGALSSLVIVEYVYIWGGAGTLFVQAVGARRLELAGELALAFAVASTILTLAADAARARLPRVT